MRTLLDAESGPWHPVARATFEATVDAGWANPRARYAEGRRAAEILNLAREQVADVLGCRTDEVSFDSSGAAASRRAVAGLAIGRRRVSRSVATSSVEHSSILQAAVGVISAGGDSGATHLSIDVDADGLIDLTKLAFIAGAEPAFVAIQAANQETGVIQDWQGISATLEPVGVPWFVDATSVLAHGEPPQKWSVLTADAPAWAGPSGVGILAVRTGARWRNPDYPSDAFELGRVPGMPSVPAIAAAAAALVAMRDDRIERAKTLAGFSAHIRKVASEQIPHVQIHSTDVGCPHITSMSFLYVSGEALAAQLDVRGFAVASGSACANELHTPSHVLAAMGHLTEGNLRITLPWNTTAEGVDAFLAQLPSAVHSVREQFGAVDL